MSNKSVNHVKSFSVNQVVTDRKNPNRPGKVVEVKDSEVKVLWADGTTWSYVDKNQRFLREYVVKTSRVFRKSKVNL